MSKHTPVPWEGFPPQDPTMIKTIIGYPGMDDSERSPITALGKGVKRKANAEFIVRACNAHQVLLDALKVALDNSRRRSEGRGKWTVKDQEAHDALRGAIAKAEEKKS